jgi:hypothetical protein
MQSYRSTHVVPGQYITPREPTQELREFVGALNAIAEDNLDAEALDESQFALDAFAVFPEEWERTSGVEVVISAQTQYGGFAAIPDNDGNPWRAEVTTPDCVLEGTLGVVVVADTGFTVNMWVGVVVDGTLVGQSPIVTRKSTGSLECEWGPVPVGSGTHVVEAVYGWATRPVADASIFFQNGNHCIRGALR